MTLFHSGQRVMCVSADPRWSGLPAAPRPGLVYTVREFFPVRTPLPADFASVTLVELSAPALVRGHIGEATFATAHFAPLADEGIDAFEALLTRALHEGPQP